MLTPQLGLALIFSAVLCFMPIAAQGQQPTSPPPNQVTEFQVCQTVNPVSGNVQLLLGYDSTYPHTQLFEPGTIKNFFSPGAFDLGQPEEYFQGTDNDLFAVSYNTGDTNVLTWVLDGTANHYSVGTAPPCNPTYFQPVAPLAYSSPGTYTHQLLGQLAFANGGVTTNIFPATGGINVSFANLSWTTTPSFSSGGVSSVNVPTQYLYGDVTVGAGPAASTALLVQVLDTGGRQIALGTDTLQFSGSPQSTTGCPTNITNSVQGTMSAPAQLFGTQIWTQLVTIKNNSGAAIPGPIQLALQNLSSNARLFTAAGTGTCPGIAGAPYITITNGLAPNAIGSVVLTFTNSTVPSAAITYTPTIVAGGSRL